MSFQKLFPACTRTVALALVLLPSAALAAPNIVVSIKPLELLVRAVATEDTRVTALVGPGANPHNFSMRPSQRQALGEADAIFWVGPELETFMSRLLASDEFSPRSHAFMSHGEHERHGSRQGKEEHENSDHNAHHHEERNDHEQKDHQDHDNHGHGDGPDPHIWLDPFIAMDMARQIHRVLTGLPEAETAVLDANLASFEQSLRLTEARIKEQLAPARELSLFTYHNAFSHFAEHYDLPLAGVLTINPELSPGARHISEVQNKLREARNPCLITEEPFSPDSWKPIVGDINVTFSIWDPLASRITPDANGYIALQQSIAEAVLGCKQNTET